MQSALRLKPSFTDAYNNMASALVQKGLIPQAVECYNAALQINPNLVCLPVIAFLKPQGWSLALYMQFDLCRRVCIPPPWCIEQQANNDIS